MNIFPRKEKQTPGAYYFGEFSDNPLAPFSITVATFDESYSGSDRKHYHTQNQKAYVTIQGKGLINVDGQSVEMSPEQMIHIEPNEVHYIEKVLEAPFQFIVILSSKTNDKIVVE